MSNHSRLSSEDMIRMGMLCAFRMSSQHWCKYLVSTALAGLQRHAQHLATTVLPSILHDFIAQQSGVATGCFVNFIGNMQCNAYNVQHTAA